MQGRWLEGCVSACMSMKACGCAAYRRCELVAGAVASQPLRRGMWTWRASNVAGTREHAAVPPPSPCTLARLRQPEYPACCPPLTPTPPRHLLTQEQRRSGTQINNISCSAAELRLLRALLARNARRTAPTPWQRENVPLGPDSPWFVSFISPVYPEQPGDLLSLSGSLGGAAGMAAAARGQGRQQPGGSAAAASPAFAAALRAAAGAAAAAAAGGTAAAAAAQTSRRGGSGSSGGSVLACGGCGEAGAKLRCTRCKAAFYCSQACQKRAWPTHKQRCVAQPGSS